MPFGVTPATREVTLCLGPGDPAPSGTTALFVFDNGALISHATLDERGEAKLHLPIVMNASVRILAGPATRPGQVIPTLDTLERLRPYEPAFNFRERRDRYVAPPIPDLHLRYWQWCRCLVHGVVIAADGGRQTPVPQARVHIRRIEPFFAFLGGLSDTAVLDLRDDFVAAAASPLSAATGLSSDSPTLVRRALTDNAVALRGHWRRSPRWWRDRCVEIAAPVTDRDGRFAFEFWNLAEDDNDLDFRVEHSTGSMICALTTWDYVCGRPVTLRIDQPRGDRR
jgi:hypothetical protein